MELWFWLAIASAISGGVGAFTHKIVAARKLDINVLNVYASIISAIILFGCTLSFSGLSHFWTLATVVALVGASTYLVTLVLKVESLKEIDSAIFFPLYKVSGPLLAILFGILFFSESFSTTEWFGLLLSLCVPLLLITRSEHMRQNNLARGVFLLLAASLIGSISIALFKYGTDISQNIWLFLFIADVFLAATSIVVLLGTHRRNLLTYVAAASNKNVFLLTIVMGVVQAAAASAMVFAFAAGGSLGVVYTINSLYILIPIILSIIFYHEHWNTRKVIAILLSIAALWFLQ